MVEWLEGMGESSKVQIEGLVADLVQTKDFRKSDVARATLTDRGKPAIPGLLRALSQLDIEEDKEEVAQAFQIIQTLREITGQNFNFRPMMTAQAFGMGGMTRATPAERIKAVRRWYGWWEVKGPKFTEKEKVKEPESWDDLDTGEEDEKPEGK